MKISQGDWAEIRHRFLDQAAPQGTRLTLRDRVWAVTPGGAWVALPGTSDSPVTDKWWLGCDPEKLRARRPLGVILLCQARAGPLYAIGLPQAVLRDVAPRLSRNDRQLFFNVVRRGDRFLLQLRGGDEVDVTARLGDISWANDGGDAALASVRESGAGAVAEGSPGRSIHADPDTPARDEATHRFFAVVKNGALYPLDEITLESGSLYLVSVREASAVPGNSSLRRIVARGGPDDLPSDFAERHDYYAHGAGRR